jgi:hypothetical protein
MADVVVLKSGSDRCVVAQWDAAEEPWVFELESPDSSEWSEASLSSRLQELVEYNLERDAMHRARAVSPPLPPPTSALGFEKDDVDPPVVIDPAERPEKQQQAI